MAYLNANIPPIYAQIRREYLYDCKKHHGEVEDCIVFGLSCITGRAILWHAIMENVASAADNLVATSVNLSSATVTSLCKLTMVLLLASMVSVKLNTYLTDVNVPASIAATTGTITMFFFIHSNLDNLFLVLAAICIFHFSVSVF